MNSNAKKPSKKIESANQQQEAYLISEGKKINEAKYYREKEERKVENRTRYVAKEESNNPKYDVDGESFEKKFVNKRNSERKQEAPRFY